MWKRIRSRLAKFYELHRRELRVGDRDDRAVEGAHLGRAQADILHGSHLVAEATEVPFRHGMIPDDHEIAEDVLQALLRRQRDRDPAHAEARNQRRHIEGREAVDGHEEGEDTQGCLEELAA